MNADKLKDLRDKLTGDGGPERGETIATYFIDCFAVRFNKAEIALMERYGLDPTGGSSAEEDAKTHFSDGAVNVVKVKLPGQGGFLYVLVNEDYEIDGYEELKSLLDNGMFELQENEDEE